MNIVIESIDYEYEERRFAGDPFVKQDLRGALVSGWCRKNGYLIEFGVYVPASKFKDGASPTSYVEEALR